MCGIILLDIARIRESHAGVVTELDTSPAVVVGGGTVGTHGRELELEIGKTGL